MAALRPRHYLACALAMVPDLKARELKMPFHLAFSYDEEVGDETVGAPSPSKFADAGVDLASLWTRTIAHFANLPTPPAVADLYVPTQRVAPDVVKWIGGAMQIALTRDQDRYDLAPDDLIQIVQSARDPDHPFHDPLKDVIDRFYPSVPLPAAAQAPVMLPALGDSPPAESGSGGLPSTEIGSRALLTRISTGFEEANRAIRSAQHTASCARTEVRRLKEALVVRIPAGSNSAEQHLTQLRTRVDELRIRLADIDARTTEIKNGQLIDLAVAIGDCRSQLTDVGLRTGEIKDTQLTALDRSVANCRNHLSELGRNTAAIRDRLPRPPAGPWIALAIVGVVVFGLALGIALSDPSSLGAVFRLALPPS